jgi:hypothetical protein
MLGQPCKQSNGWARWHRRNGAPTLQRACTGHCCQSTFRSCRQFFVIWASKRSRSNDGSGWYISTFTTLINRDGWCLFGRHSGGRRFLKIGITEVNANSAVSMRTHSQIWRENTLRQPTQPSNRVLTSTHIFFVFVFCSTQCNRKEWAIS